MTVERAESQLMSMEDYLAWENEQQVKHEYIGGVVYAMAGARNRHNLVASNVMVSIGPQLRGKPCKTYNSDTKVRVLLPTHTRFYYPDVMVVCQPSSPDLSYQEGPTVIVEVISERSRRTDQQEKREAYLALGTLQIYLIVEQASAAATIWRRADQGFAGEVYAGLDAVIALPEIGAQFALAEVYDGLNFGPDPDDDIDTR